MMIHFFVDICQPDKEIGFVLILEKIELCTTSYSTNLDNIFLGPRFYCFAFGLVNLGFITYSLISSKKNYSLMKGRQVPT